MTTFSTFHPVTFNFALSTLIFNLDLDNVKLKQHAEYLGQSLQRSFASNVIVRTHRDTRDTGLPGPVKWLGKTVTLRCEG